MKNLLACSFLVLGAVASSHAGSYFYSGALTSSNPVFRAPGASSTGVGQYYSVLPFTVGTSGAYSFETASPNTSSGFVSDALDTYLVLYAGAFDPSAPGTYTALNDDYTGLFTVLPGPFGNVSSTSTGSANAQPGSQIASASLVAGQSYFLVNTSYRDTSVVASSGAAGPVGSFFTGISGVGAVSSVPEPSALAALGVGAVAVLRRRKRG